MAIGNRPVAADGKRATSGLKTQAKPMPPLVSILIPAYNSEAWIADTIKSALAQTWPRTEIIVVDDGSKDQTLEIAKQFAGAKVSVATQSNQGAAAARNNALKRSQGEY